MRRLKDRAQFPGLHEREPNTFAFFRWGFGFFIFFWVVCALASLGLTIAAIYFLVKVASTF